MELKELVELCKKAALEAGKEILSVYESDDFGVEIKDDKSPLTMADKKSHLKIMEYLENTPYPIMSEEGKEILFEERKDWDTFWCVDPLDGTKEFVNRNGQFTVNIALIRNGYPVLGMIYVPVTDEFYYGAEGIGAFKQEGENAPFKIVINRKEDNRVAVKSRSHGGDEDDLFKKFKVTDTISVGSSLKFCMVASGVADIYFREGPTMEWDTAAGQAVVEAAEGTVDTLQGERFFYNKEVLRNGSFLVKGF